MYSGDYRHYGPTFVGSFPIGGFFPWLVVLIVVLVLAVTVFTSGSQNTVTASTVNRERLSAGNFTASCVEDNLGWVASEQALGEGLQSFWDETGIQPYVVLEPYSEEHDSAAERSEWADSYYTEQVGREDAMLLVYFDDEPDGNWEMVCGNLTGEVLDAEAKQIVWDCLDRYWNDLTYEVPDAIANGLESAAERMMTKTTTWKDVVKTIVIICGVIGVILAVIALLAVKRRNDREKVEEEERILNTPIDQLGADNDPLVGKYSNDGEE